MAGQLRDHQAGSSDLSSKELQSLKSKTKSGKHLITLSGHAKTMKLVMVDDFENEFLAVVTNRGRLLIFPVSELPQLSKGKGNKLIQITKPSSIEQIEIISDLCILNDVQKLKRIGEGSEIGTASTQKRAVYGALTLYLDFINLFLFLLRLIGGRD